MSRAFVSASSTELEKTEAVVTAYPFSASIWFYPTGLGSIQNLFVNGVAASIENDRFDLRLLATDLLNARQKDGGATSGVMATSNAANSGAWNHAFLARDDGDHELMLNGDTGNSSTSTAAAVTVSDHDQLELGGTADPYDGLLAWATFWNVRLTLSEGSLLASGINPERLRPEAILASYPIWGVHSPEVDLRGGTSLTLVNSPASDARQPPMHLWSPSRRVSFLDPPTSGVPAIAAASSALAPSRVDQTVFMTVL